MMKSTQLLGLLVVVASLYLLFNVTFNDKLDGSEQGSFTYFAFEREWPGTVCKTKKCTAQYMGNYNSKNFNLHGLWPSGLESDVCDYPQDCGSSQFSFSNIENQEVVSYMKAYWVGLYSSQQSFLNHEWTKHGTCLTDSQNEFFTLAVELHQYFNPVDALASFGIVPSDKTPYTFDEINYALATSFGAPVRIQCQTVNGSQMLFSFDMYFDKSLLNVISQPCKKNSSCSTEKPIYYPTLPSF